jgi:archaellum biogenesis ATPase FlaH/5S rRNA maturation endonuclease (ribonuclease M5)
MIKKLKQIVGQDAKRIIAAGLSMERKGKKYRCPNGSSHHNNDEHHSMSWDENAFQFYCFVCNEKIDIYSYHRRYEGMEHNEIMEKYGVSEKNVIRVVDSNQHDRKILDFSMKQLNEIQIKYLIDRGIELETQKYFGFGNHGGCIAIPYFDENSVTGIKKRNLKEGNKYFSVKGSKFGLFNKHNVTGSSIIITEGEFDAAIIHQCGFKNIVSVGTGAVSIEKIFKQEKTFLDKFDSITVIGDNDPAGLKMESSFKENFAYKVKTVDKSFFDACNDISEVFLKNGKNGVSRIVESAKMNIRGLRNLDTHPYSGIELKKGDFISTGIKTLDYALNDLGPEKVTIITGRSNEGKSTLTNQVIINAIDQKKSVMLVAGEGIQEIIINKIYNAVIGKNESLYDEKLLNRRILKEPKREVLAELRLWHKKKLTIFSKEESNYKSTDELFNMLESVVKINKINLLIIDNLMSLLTGYNAIDKYDKQKDFLERCMGLAKRNKIHVILVAHPNKSVVKGASMNFEQIGGSADLFGLADNIISIRRSKDNYGIIDVLKNRYYSQLPKVNVYFDEETETYLEFNKKTGECFAYELRFQKDFLSKVI